MYLNYSVNIQIDEKARFEKMKSYNKLKKTKSQKVAKYPFLFKKKDP